MDESPQATERQARPSHVRTSRSRWLRRLALTALLLALVPVLVVAMLFYSESGFKTLAGLAVRMSGEALQIDAPTGRLADRLHRARVEARGAEAACRGVEDRPAGPLFSPRSLAFAA